MLDRAFGKGTYDPLDATPDPRHSPDIASRISTTAATSKTVRSNCLAVRAHHGSRTRHFELPQIKIPGQAAPTLTGRRSRRPQAERPTVTEVIVVSGQALDAMSQGDDATGLPGGRSRAGRWPVRWRSRGYRAEVQRPGCFLADFDTTESQGVHQVVQILDRTAHRTIDADGAHYPR